MYKRICILLCFLILISSVSAFAEGKETSISSSIEKYNVMLLIDKSGSMNETDKLGLAKSAACQFIDQMKPLSDTLLEHSSITSVGVMAFAKESELISPIVPLDSSSNADYLKNKINEITYLKAGTGGTDLSIAVNDALKQLYETPKDEKKMVVLFTDGYSEYVKDGKISEEALQNAFSLSKELSCEVFVVGMNYGNKIKEKGQQEIYNIANSTQIGNGVSPRAGNDANNKKPLSNYLITQDIGAVREFYGRIRANMMNSDLVYIDNHEFTIESSGILEADITIYAGSQITSVVVTDPDGVKQEENKDDYVEEGDDYYRVIKIANPKMGTWHLDVSSKKDDYHSYIVQFYGMEMDVKADWAIRKEFPNSGLKTPLVGRVQVVPMYKGEVYQDDILKNGRTKVILTVTKDNESKEYELKYQDNLFIGYFPVEFGEYGLNIQLTNDIIKRSADCKLSVSSETAHFTVDLGNMVLKQKDEKIIDLQEKIEGAFQIKNLEAKSEKSSISFEKIENNKLKIQALKTGDAEIFASAIDEYGIYYDIIGNITVKFKMFWYHWTFIVLSITGTIWLYKKMQRVLGTFEMSLEMTLDGFRIIDGPVKRHSGYVRGSSFSIIKLLTLYEDDLKNRIQTNQKLEERFQKELKEEKKELSKLMVHIEKIKSGNDIEKVYKINGKKIPSEAAEFYKSRDGQFVIKIGFKPIKKREEENPFAGTIIR